MTHKVKICGSCGHHNAPDEVLCQKCGLMLPGSAVDLDGPATRQSMSFDPPSPRPPETKTTPPETPAKAEVFGEGTLKNIKKTPPKPQAREWPYEAVPIRLGGRPLRVTVVDFDMGFWSMVEFMVKAAFAAIPAILIIMLITTGLLAVLSLLGMPLRSGA